MELTIKEQVYQFNFGMGFLREMNRKVTMPVDGIKDVKRHIGLRYMVCLLYTSPSPRDCS